MQHASILLRTLPCLTAQLFGMVACTPTPYDQATSAVVAPAAAPAAATPAAATLTSTGNTAPMMTDQQVIDRFHDIFYTRTTPWAANKWMGVVTLQNPFDVWITQEIIVETKPDFIVECGAFHGGSAALWAMVLEQVNPEGRIISVDIEDKMADARKLPIVQERVEYIIGSSTAVDIVDQVKAKVGNKKVLVILDSDHRKAHVSSELKIYSKLIPVGGYLIVQDSNINGHPTAKGWGEGPMEAIVEFLRDNKNFEADRARERMLMTFNPNGYLKRLK